jgi:regulatory protein
MGGKITALKFQKRKKQRVNVYLDGRYAFSLAAIEAARLKLGQTLSDEEIKRLKGKDSFHRAYDRALRFLTYRPRSRAEVKRYLEEKGVQPTSVEEVLERLTRAGLLDDMSFARYWVENRETFNPRGLVMLRYELRKKGLDDEIIAQAISGLDEEESAYRAAIRRCKRLAHLDRRSFRRKMSSYLSRRGFPYEVVKEVVERVWKELKEGPDESEEGL